MSNPTISIIAALDENRAIGKDNKLLWHIPDDLRRFKRLTLHHPVIMGRKTYESIGRLLPERTNIIVTANPYYKVPGAIITQSIEAALNEAKKIDPKEIFIIGGAKIYQEAIIYADKLYVTLVKGIYDADAYFPDYSQFSTVVSKESGRSGIYRYTIMTLTR